jgi:hypothetical protein
LPEDLTSTLHPLVQHNLDLFSATHQVKPRLITASTDHCLDWSLPWLITASTDQALDNHYLLRAITASAELFAEHSTTSAFLSNHSLLERSLPSPSDNKTIVFFTPERIYMLRREIHSWKEGAKKGGHTEEKRLHKKSKAWFWISFILIWFTFYSLLNCQCQNSSICCTYVCSPNSSSIDKRKNCQCWNSGIRQFRLLYICLSEQQYATDSAPVHSRRLPISSFFLRKKEDIHQQDIKQYNNRFTNLAHYVHIPVKPTINLFKLY